MTEVDSDKKVLDEITKYAPAEILCNDYFPMCGINLDDIGEKMHISISVLESWYSDESLCLQKLKEHFHVASLEGLGLSDYPTGTIAAGMLLQYLYETQKNALPQMTKITPYQTERFMVLDTATRRNLELLKPFGRSRNAAPSSGFSTKQKRRWAPVCCEAALNSPFFRKI